MDPHTKLIIRQILIGVMIFSFIGSLVYSIWYITRLEVFTINSIQTEGGETISHDEVKNRAQTQLKGAYLGLIPYVFTYTYPKQAIYDEVSKVNRIKDVKVWRDNRKTIKITFDEYVPEALWCNSENEEVCVFLDENGYGFTTAPSLSGGALTRYNFIGRNAESGAQFLTVEKYKQLDKLKTLLKDAGWYVSQVYVDSADDIYIQIVGGGELKATLAQTPTEIVNNLVTVLSSEEFSHIVPGNFKYIDLRFGNKVFVNEVLVSKEVIEEAEFSTTTEAQIEEVEQEDEITEVE